MTDTSTEIPPGAPVQSDGDASTVGDSRPVAPRSFNLPIEALQDVELKVEVLVGRVRLRLQTLLEIRPGQVIELDRTRNSPVEVLVNGTLFARGEIVVIDESHLGVRIGEVVGADGGKEAH